MIEQARSGLSDLEFCDLALHPTSGIAECFNAAGIDGCLARPGIASGELAGPIDATIE